MIPLKVVEHPFLKPLPPAIARFPDQMANCRIGPRRLQSSRLPADHKWPIAYDHRAQFHDHDGIFVV